MKQVYMDMVIGMEKVEGTLYGDYVGNIVNHANCDIIAKMFSRCKGVYLIGDFCSTCIMYNKKECSSHTLERIRNIEKSIKDYPCLDDDYLETLSIKIAYKGIRFYSKEWKKELKRHGIESKNIDWHKLAVSYALCGYGSFTGTNIDFCVESMDHVIADYMEAVK